MNVLKFKNQFNNNHSFLRLKIKEKKEIISYSELEKLKLKGFGKTIMKKIKKFLDDGILVKSNNNSISELMKVYGIGFKKAEELYKTHNIKSISELKNNINLLNNTQI